jgi:hypothetical protein
MNIPYNKFLRQSNPISLIKGKGMHELNTHVIGQTYIPPLNANINFTSLSRFSLAEHQGLNDISSTILRENFNWNEITSDDSDIQKLIKQNITRPANQHLCGSCWEYNLLIFI